MASGTSGAVPTIAAIITLVNDARMAAGKNPVGQPEAFYSGIENLPNIHLQASLIQLYDCSTQEQLPFYHLLHRYIPLLSLAHSMTSPLAPVKAAMAVSSTTTFFPFCFI